MELNSRIYGDMFVPILWIDDRTRVILEEFMRRYHRLDVFVP